MADTGLKTNFGKPLRSPDALDQLVKAAEAAFVDLPFAALKRLVGGGEEREVYAAGWKAYDALINAATEAINGVYTSETYGRVAGRAIEVGLGVYRINAAGAGAFFAALWPALGIPTAGQVEALREEIGVLHEEVREARAAARHNAPIDTEPAVVARVARTFERPIWERWAIAEGAEVKDSVGN